MEMNEIKKDLKSIVCLIGTLWVLFLGYRGLTYYIEWKYMNSLKSYYLFIENNWNGIEKAMLQARNEEELNRLMGGVNFYMFVQDNFLKVSTFDDIEDVAIWQKEEFIKDPKLGYHQLFENARGFEFHTDEMKKIVYQKI